MSTTTQVGLAALSLAGVPLALLAGFGTLWNLDFMLRLFHQYMIVQQVIDTYW